METNCWFRDVVHSGAQYGIEYKNIEQVFQKGINTITTNSEDFTKKDMCIECQLSAFTTSINANFVTVLEDSLMLFTSLSIRYMFYKQHLVYTTAKYNSRESLELVSMDVANLIHYPAILGQQHEPGFQVIPIICNMRLDNKSSRCVVVSDGALHLANISGRLFDAPEVQELTYFHFKLRIKPKFWWWDTSMSARGKGCECPFSRNILLWNNRNNGNIYKSITLDRSYIKRDIQCNTRGHLLFEEDQKRDQQILLVEFCNARKKLENNVESSTNEPLVKKDC
ncbi:hypothetical protein Bhyg_09600 [Pseudolycoriella hygida]|uniref:Uncharacterized protein n=1 Tax=Pseudolycoriella hygida TaxID=35572 RepID=A0A9Q0N8B7_9DIPT|nr:hypothetical protein Bhyg_09600 [Pseudolycoriella hygida]